MTADSLAFSTSSEVIGAVNKLESSVIPLLASPQGGWLRHQVNFAQPPKLTQTGWFSLCSHRKTTPSSRSADASRYFLDRSATPPCGDARRGVAPTVAQRQFFTAPMTAPIPLIAGITGGHRPPLQLLKYGSEIDKLRRNRHVRSCNAILVGDLA